MRQRINITIAPIYYAELQRICKDYKFTNLCEICLALISTFIQYVNSAEHEKRNPDETNEEFIRRMFSELGTWEPTPETATMYKRHTRRATIVQESTTKGNYEKSSSEVPTVADVDIFDLDRLMRQDDNNDSE